VFKVSEMRILFLGQTLMHNPQPLQRSLLISMRPFKIFSLPFLDTGVLSVREL
jgi:hypothetical protein